MRKPGYAVALSAACLMLNQIIVACFFLLSRACKFSNRIKLMIAGENHGFPGHFFPSTGTVINGGFACLQKDEAADDIKKALPFKHLFPEIARAVARWMLRIALTIGNRSGAAASVERQKKGITLVQAGSHVNFIRINSKVNFSSFYELKERSMRVAFILYTALWHVSRFGRSPDF